jgi:hypothetical protein
MMRQRQGGVIGEMRQRFCVSVAGGDPASRDPVLSDGRMRTHACRGM